MTFIAALKTGRPMRRDLAFERPWVYLGEEPVLGRVHGLPTWHRIDTGERTGLHVDDYVATDWEVMP